MCLLGLAGILFIIYLVLSPNPGEPLFWCLILPALAANFGYIVLSKRERRQYDQQTDEWIDEVRKLVGDEDLSSTIERDPHFADYGQEEREEILRALRSQPSLRRSLDAALRETGLDFRKG